MKSLFAYVAVLRASAALGRCSRQQKQGRFEVALASARRGLQLLRPHHSHDMVTVTRAVLTVYVESLARRLDAPGASAADLEAAINVLRSQAADEAMSDLVAWVPHMEARLARARSE